MERTNFAGLTRPDIAEAISADNYSFQHLNPKIIDYLLQLGAKTHKHDNHPGLANPSTAPVVVIDSTGGTIPADTALYVGYTLLDAQGGETELIQPPVLVTTPAGLSAPTTAPTLALDTTAGGLLAGQRQYGVTVTDGAGGETEIGPLSQITVPPGYATARVDVSGLAAIVSATAPGVTGAQWRLYVMIDGQNWQFLDAGTTDTFTDDGSVPVQCINPPAAGTTHSTYAVTITVPAGQDANAVSANIYVSPDGSFQAPCLLANIAAANFGTAYTYGTLSFSAEQPPPVNLSIGGANQIDPDNDMLNFPWKRPVANFAALPTASNTDGDLRVTLDTHEIYAWHAADTAWHLVVGGMSYRGAFDPAVAYQAGDLVTHANSLYIAPAALAAGAWNAADWTLIVEGVQPNGAWGFVGQTGEPAFGGTWVNVGTNPTGADASGIMAASYRVDSQGQYHLRGRIKSGVLGTAAFTLPAGPTGIRRHVVDGNGAFAVVEVHINGDVVPTVGDVTDIALDGISFFTD